MSNAEKAWNGQTLWKLWCSKCKVFSYLDHDATPPCQCCKQTLRRAPVRVTK